LSKKEPTLVAFFDFAFAFFLAIINTFQHNINYTLYETRR
jgi:hypothetical protein